MNNAKTLDDRLKPILTKYFNTDFSNDNIPSLIYDCFQSAITINILTSKTRKIKKTTIKEAYYHFILDEMDALFIKLRLLFSKDEKYSAGSFLKEMAQLATIKIGELEDYYTPHKDNAIIIIKSENLKSRYIRKNGEIVCKSNDIHQIYNYGYNYTVVSYKHILILEKKIKKLYQALYKNDGNYPDFISNYQKERFHQNKHSDDKKYEIIIKKYSNFFTTTRRTKPHVDLNSIFDILNTISDIALSFENLCRYRSGPLISRCIFGRHTYMELIDNRAKALSCGECNYITKLHAILFEEFPKLCEITYCH